MLSGGKTNLAPHTFPKTHTKTDSSGVPPYMLIALGPGLMTPVNR